MLTPGSLISLDWYMSHGGRETLLSLLQRNMNRRKTFGLLEKPSFPAETTPEECKYKVFFVGKGGVGKTSTIAKLSGNEILSTHSETPGIQSSTAYWPAKITNLNKIIMFHLQLWDAGENAIKKFDHILPACTEKADAYIMVFSFIDKSSFDDIPQQIGRLSSPTDDTTKIVIGTKFDQQAHSEVTQRDIRDFEQQWDIPVLKIRNLADHHHGDLNEVMPILNTICEHLWQRDLTLAGKMQETPEPSSGDKISYC